MAAKHSVGLFESLAVFLVMALYFIYVNHGRHILLAVGATLILYSTTKGDLVGSLLAGAMLPIAIYFLTGRKTEGFADMPEEEYENEEEEKEKHVAKEGFATKKRTPPPDHADRPAEMFQLGKKYKMPVTEDEDKEFHLDAGTTFMNAYKSLKPEQIAAMTKDTQELMETQKQLMSTLSTLKPLISDSKQMMEMFKSYFGSGNPTSN
jgi:hypothetical protein